MRDTSCKLRVSVLSSYVKTIFNSVTTYNYDLYSVTIMSGSITTMGIGGRAILKK